MLKKENKPSVKSKEQLDEFTSIAYKVAGNVAFLNYRALESIGVEKDDFIQDAVMYVLDLYINDYWKDDGRGPAGMVFYLLQRFVKNAIQTNGKRKDRYKLFLDKDTFSNDNNVESEIEQVEDLNTLDPSQQMEYEQAEDILVNKVLPKLSMVANRSTHMYIGNVKKDAIDNEGNEYETDEILEADMVFSEYNIARLILAGYDIKKILKVFDAYSDNIGKSSRATVVNRKYKKTIEKIAKIINELPDDEIDLLKKYIEKILNAEEEKYFSKNPEKLAWQKFRTQY